MSSVYDWAGSLCEEPENFSLYDVLGLPLHPSNPTDRFLPGPGKQELYEGSDIYISKVEIQNIHIEAGKKPTEMLNKLLGYYFDLQTLASQRNRLDDRIVHACTGMSITFIFLAFMYHF